MEPMNMKEPLSTATLSSLFKTDAKDEYRIISREGTTIEFKESFSYSASNQYYKVMASFANNRGGYIIFGVSDKPRRLVGLKGKSLQRFEELKAEELTKGLLDCFSPEIRWTHCTFEYRGLSFGVIYTFPLQNKPCICKKTVDSQNPKHALKEGDIYYRHVARSERIKYSELREIIEQARKHEEQQWLRFILEAQKIGVDNIGLLDLERGEISGEGGTIVIDDGLLSKIAFIKEGEFVEKGGKPTLRLIGDIKEVKTGKVIVKEGSQKIVRAIETSDIIECFLTDNQVQEPKEYIKVLSSSTSANYPVYCYLYQASCNIAEAIEIINGFTSRGVTKDRLIARLKGKRVESAYSSNTNSTASDERKVFVNMFINEEQTQISNVKRCMEALISLSDEDIERHEKFVRDVLYRVFKTDYEKADASTAGIIRKAICKVDEVLFLKKCL